MFSRNVSSRDRDIRLVLGALLSYLAVFVIHGLLGYIAGGLAIVCFATAAAGFCPLYRIVGITTCAPAEQTKHN